MPYSPIPTVATGDLWTAGNHNQYIRDNFAALWPYVAAGDLAIATGVDSLGKISKGNELNVLSVLGGVVGWGALSNLIKIYTSNTFAGDTTNNAYVDVSGSSFTFTLSRPATTLTFLAGQASVANADTLYYRMLLDGAYQQEFIESFHANFERTTIALNLWTMMAGTRTMKAQFHATNGTRVNLYNAKIFVLAIPG